MKDRSPAHHQAWTVDQYIEHRLDPQQKYCSKKSSSAQNNHKRLRWAEIVAAAMIPVLAIVPKETANIQLAIGFVGALVTILAGFLALGKYSQDAIRYRVTSEALKAEKMYFLTRCGEYGQQECATDTHEQQRLEKLVHRVEAILKDENEKWYQVRQQQKPGKQGK